MAKTSNVTQAGKAKDGKSKDGKPKGAKSKKAKAGESPDAKAGAGEPLGNKDYERELKKLHVELVKMQEWVKHAGLKVCIVFEGRDTAGKVDAIKAITERVSPRTFRVSALTAH